MGVNIDKAGGDNPSFGVQLFARGAADVAHGNDPVALYPDIGEYRRTACPVNDLTAADYQIKIVGHCLSYGLYLS
jgi:hypothetical protein